MPKKSSSSVKIYYPPYDRNEAVKQIRAGVETLSRYLPVRKVILFGSYAKNRHTVASDIDLLVVYRGSPREDAFTLVRKHIPLPRLEPHIYTEKEYRLLKKVIDPMVAEGVAILENGQEPEAQGS